ncbi:sciellin [Chelmon rostratus]|uniref:sciellin n=1 Tax=Chelmon rostratus TaxID=109905 RepID=UPI001BED31DD|nr:sciellin [Chelmon rostratus]
MSRYSAAKSTLLKDNSWIRKTDDEDEDIDRDPNFGKFVLSHHRSNENLESPGAEETNTTKPSVRPSTSVQALTKRFSGSLDEPRSSTLPPSKTTSSYTKSTYSSPKPDSFKTTTTSTVTKDGTSGTTTTTTQTLKSPGATSPTKTFTERVKSSSKGAQYSQYSPTRTTKVTETVTTKTDSAEDKLYDTLIPFSAKDDLTTTDSKTTVSMTKTVPVNSSADTKVEDSLYDTLIPSAVKGDSSPTDSKTFVSSTETVTVNSSPDGDGFKTTTTTRTSTAEDDLYGTLLPKSITSDLPSPVSSSITRREIVTVDSSKGGESPTLASPSPTKRTSSYSSYTDDIPSTRTTSYTVSTTPSDDYSSDRKTYSYSRPNSSYEYSSVTSPTVYTTPSYRSSSRSDDILADPSSSMKSAYAPPERTVLEKDLCSYCRKPFIGDAKMVLEDVKINCHASCFKCEVCHSTLGHMKAGDSLWIYKHMVHCENCFEVTREKWRR